MMASMDGTAKQTTLLGERDRDELDVVGSFVEVGVNLPLFRAFTYSVPEAMSDAVQPGVRVLVPFRGRSTVALVIGACDPPKDAALRKKILPLGDVLDSKPMITANNMRMLRWMAGYYCAPIGEVLKLALPPGLWVTSSRALEITDAGKRALMAGVVTDNRHRALLEALSKTNEAVDLQVLRGQIAGLTYMGVAQCERAGWTLSRYVASKAKTSIKYEKWIVLSRDPFVDERLGKKQEHLVAVLQELGEAVCIETLREEVDKPLASLRALAKRGIVEIEEREVYRDPFASEPVSAAQERELTPDQARVVGEVLAQIDVGRFKSFLLHGVTGSGKTEVYVRVIKEVLSRGRNGIVLLPEISLTPQFVAVFRSHFGDDIAVLHSGLSAGERFDAWRRIHRGEVRIAIGARSVIFAPMPDLGVIIVDEEHDTSFKQEAGCRYNARDVAQYRCRITDSVAILGSATPAVETYYNARCGRIGYLPMSSRVADRALPEVQIIDMREGPEDKARKKRREPVGEEQAALDTLSSPLVEAIEQTLRQQEQVILFLNRRGFSPYVACNDCGVPWRCPNCSVSLTLHKKDDRLRCHYCDHNIPTPEVCADCHSPRIGKMGVGTERLEAALGQLFTDARVARLDRDTGQGKGLLQLINRFRRHEIDILLGTQMVTKGHDFHNVTLVGVIMADQGLNFPDFRSGERTFQLMTQVAGRAGRGAKPGRVIIQTYTPWHYSLQAASQHSYSEFVAHELHSRSALNYPPLAHLIAVLFEGAEEHSVSRAARQYTFAAKRLVAQDETLTQALTILGPAQAPLSRLRGKTRWQMLVKGADRKRLRKMLGVLLTQMGFFDTKTHFKGVRVSVDVDPQSLL